jgi:predicted signal transduction protein with EAL and GGDEF domain
MQRVLVHIHHLCSHLQAGDLQAGIAALEEGLDTVKLQSRMRVTFHALKSTLHMSRGENAAAIEGYSTAAGRHGAVQLRMNVRLHMCVYVCVCTCLCLHIHSIACFVTHECSHSVTSYAL